MTLAPPAPPALPPVVPPTAESPAVPPVPPAPPRPGARVIAIAMIAIGALIAVSTIGWALAGTVASLAVHTTTRTVAVSGVTDLRVDARVADVTIVFASVPGAELEVTGRRGAEGWTLDAKGSELVVAGGDHEGGGFRDRGDRAVLRLPVALSGIDADLALDAGDLSVEGEFGDLSVTVGSGDVDLDTTARMLEVAVDGGDASIEAADVDEADFAVTAGDLSAELAGAQPATVRVRAEAADVALTVPAGSYRLLGDATDDDVVDTDLVGVADAASSIDVTASLSDVSIEASR